jgi:hypothetical protein
MTLACALNTKRVVDPIDKAIRARTTKLNLEFVLRDLGFDRFCVATDVYRGTDFVRANNLPVVDEEDSHFGGVH